jgi:hypothetical protein
MADFRDIKEDIVKGISNILPTLQRFFQLLRPLVLAFAATLNIIKTTQESDGPKRQWLIITNYMVEELNRRYDSLL